MKLNDTNSLISLWHFFNISIFKGVLKKVPSIFVIDQTEAKSVCQYRGTKNILAYYLAHNNSISFCFEVIEDDNDLIATLIHEMIHQYQAQTNNHDLNHGQEFHKWKRKIKRRLNIDV